MLFADPTGVVPTGCRVGQAFRLSNYRSEEERLSSLASRRKVARLPSVVVRKLLIATLELQSYRKFYI